MAWVSVLNIAWFDWNTGDPVTFPFLSLPLSTDAGMYQEDPWPAQAHEITKIRLTATAITNSSVPAGRTFLADFSGNAVNQVLIEQPLVQGATCVLSGEFVLDEPIPAGGYPDTNPPLGGPAKMPDVAFYVNPDGAANVQAITFDVTQLEVFVDAPVPPPLSEAFIYTMNRVGQVGAWSRYLFPFAVDAFAQLGNALYIRNGDVISRVDETAATDDVAGVPTNFLGRAQWSWLDFGKPGVTKMLEGFDYVGTGQGPSISIGFDQRDEAAFTAPYPVDPDTLPGGIIPLPVMAPTLSIRMDYTEGGAWTLQSVLLQFFDQGNGP